MSTYFAILTAVGEAKRANAETLGTIVQITHMAVGDGNGATPVPNRLQTALVNEVRRAPINTLDNNPSDASQIIVEQVIPENVGGWWIREIGLYDADGDLVAVANAPATYKPALAEGSGRTQVVRMVLIWGSSAAIQLKIDPAVVLATRQYCDDKVADELNKWDSKQSVRVATTAAIALAGLQTIDGVVLVAGDRVLVKDQAAGAENGIYVAAAGAWARATDADSGVKLNAGALVPVEAGTVNADTIWMLKTDGAIIIGATPIAFQWAGGLNAPTQAAGDNSAKVANTAFVQAAIAALVASSPAALDTLNELAAALGNDANFAATVTNALALKAPLASPALTGSPSAPTPLQFDADTSLATTEFVKRQGLQLAGISYYTASTTLPLADVGKAVFVNFAAAGGTISLPSAAIVPAGAIYTVYNWGAQSFGLAAPAGQTINNNTSNPQTFTMQPYSTVILIAETGTGWVVIGGSGQLTTSPLFGSSSAGNGYQKLPSGLIIQWASGVNTAAAGNQTITLPLTFPNAHLKTLVSSLYAISAQNGGYGFISATSSQVTVARNNADNGNGVTPLILSIGY